MGAGTNLVTGARDFDYVSGPNRLTVDIANEFVPYGYKVIEVRYFNSHKDDKIEYCNISVTYDKDAMEEIKQHSRRNRVYDSSEEAISEYKKSTNMPVSDDIEKFSKWLFSKYNGDE